MNFEADAINPGAGQRSEIRNGHLNIMAINLFCYSAVSIEKTKIFVERLRRSHASLFLENFPLTEAKEITEIQRSIAREFDFEARGIFLLFVNRKDALEHLGSAEEKIRMEFGAKNILILFENETVRHVTRRDGANQSTRGSSLGPK